MIRQSVVPARGELRLPLSRRSTLGGSAANSSAAMSLTRSACCRVTVLALVAAMFVGMPQPANAATDESVVPYVRSAPNEEPLSRSLRSSKAWESWSLSGQEVETLTRGATSTDADGRSSISAARQEPHPADVLIGGMVVAHTELGVSREGGMESVRLGAGAGQQSTSGGRRGRGALFWTAVGAGVGVAGAFIANATNPACDEPDNMCSANVVVFGGLGALMGLFVGLGR